MRKPLGQFRGARHFERHTFLAERPLGAHDALRDGWLRHQKGASDFFGG
jgi:hypothetical protein